METTSNNERFFTLHKVFWWAVYSLMLSGLLACYVFFEVRVMGNDLEVRSGQSAKR